LTHRGIEAGAQDAVEQHQSSQREAQDFPHTCDCAQVAGLGASELRARRIIGFYYPLAEEGRPPGIAVK
jgi:hypothetical protein